MALPDGAIARLESGGRQHAAKRVDGRAKTVIGRGAEADHHAVRIGDVRTGQWMAQPSQPGERHPGLADRYSTSDSVPSGSVSSRCSPADRPRTPTL